MARTCAIRGWLFALALAVAPVAGAEEFEALVPESPARLLPPARAMGPDFHVVDPVAGDGLMHRYVLETRYGRFDAYGTEGVAARVHEVEALATLARTTDVGVVVGAVGERITGSARSVVDVAAHPVDTVVGIPRGISHLFRGYAAEARELGESAGPPGGGITDGAPERTRAASAA